MGSFLAVGLCGGGWPGARLGVAGTPEPPRIA